MDTVQKAMAGFSLDLGPLKEPLGFIRVLEWVFSIFAFATIGGYTGTTHLTVSCPDGDQPVEAFFAYPFRLAMKPYCLPPSCNGSCTETYLQGDFSSSAQFFVCVGVFAFLYCTATLIVYLGYRSVYLQTSRGPVIDLLLTAAFAFLWLVSSSAWGKGLTDVKYATDPNRLVQLCTSCKAGEFPSMGRLNASVIFGFLNLILWAGNCWFIYKETPFHKVPAPPTTMQEGGAPGP
ncbi:synaptophysin-like protein 2a isoform X2 [Maylandia zebra]|uniref:Synaptophysin like 2 n=3 Tax=Haplochromini TaxID=319058 RepID=A0A3B4FXU8_9CICH|nr:synaptophysin-like protein 1 isoform X1 [Maylandia zebra]XP_005749927.1 PREDICTED: synaptophysin-like protein 2 [Pundamilia nyererei]